MKTYLIGHRKPDLDSVVATLAYGELLEALGEKNLVPGRIDPLNEESKYVFKKFASSPPRPISLKEIKDSDQIILVDHNEKNHRLEGLNQDQIIAILDHHYRISLDLNQPIKIDIRPWGATNSIIYDLFSKNNLQPKPKTAKLMLAAIISDTLGLKSPTTTKADRQAVNQLGKITGLGIKKLTFEIFKAKSAIDKLTPKQIVTNDYKIFPFGGKRTLINQIETVEQESVLKMKVQLIKAMAVVKREQKIDYMYNVITDILKENSQLIYLDEKDKKVAESAFGGRGEDNVLDIGPRLSRKKQIAPEIEKVLS